MVKTKKILFIIVIGAMGTIIIFGIITEIMLFLISANGYKINHLSDFDRFYREEVVKYFKLPKEAIIIYAEEYYYPIMGWHMIVRFKLPPIKSPKEWVATIAKESGIDKYKKNDFLYDVGGDIYKVQYYPKEDIYEVMYLWD